MKVLHVGEYVKGGVATYLHTLFSGDESNGVDNYVALSRSMSDKDWELPSSKIYYYSYVRNLWHVPLAMIRIWKIIRQINPDILMVHSTWAGLFVRFPCLFIPKGKRKIIYNAHGWAFLRDTSVFNKKIYANIERVLAYVTDCIINVSDYEQRAAVACGLPKAKMQRIYNGLDGTVGTAVIKIDGFDSSKINLLFVGRFDRQKGLDWLLEQFQHNITRQDIHLYVIGASVVDKQNISIPNSRVTFLGWVDRHLINAYYKLCDALIMPSRWEAFGFTAVEAMQNGRPVLASNRGALPEIVHSSESGWLFELDSSGQSLNGILNSLDKNNMQDIGVKARKAYEANFTATKMRKAIYCLYHDFCNYTDRGE